MWAEKVINFDGIKMDESARKDLNYNKQNK